MSNDTGQLKTRVIGDAADPPLLENGDEARLFESLPVKPRGGRYKFIRSIGFGGMKAVLLVEDRDTGREVAMAMIPDFRDRPHRDLERFAGEARITAMLEHPNIVPVHDIGIDASGAPYFTMKYLRGVMLEKIVRELRSGDADTLARYPLFRRLQIFLRVCNAINFAHSHGVCHLDIKPGNINIGDYGEVVVLDWGVARMLDDAGRAKLDDLRPKGTPGYIAPEYLNPASADQVGIRSDIYSLGGLLYTLLTLQAPLAGLSVGSILRRTAAGALPRPSLAAPGRDIPASLEAVCMKAMARKPAARYSSVQELRDEITAYLAGFSTQAEHAGPFRRVALFTARHWMTLLLVAALLLIAALVWALLNA